jgi:hypothetical protein
MDYLLLYAAQRFRQLGTRYVAGSRAKTLAFSFGLSPIEYCTHGSWTPSTAFGGLIRSHLIASWLVDVARIGHNSSYPEQLITVLLCRGCGSVAAGRAHRGRLGPRSSLVGQACHLVYLPSLLRTTILSNYRQSWPSHNTLSSHQTGSLIHLRDLY